MFTYPGCRHAFARHRGKHYDKDCCPPSRTGGRQISSERILSRKETNHLKGTDCDVNNNREKVIYTAKVHTTGGGTEEPPERRRPSVTSGHSVPGTSGAGTNPEQLFAAGWSACFEGAMGIAARKMKTTLPAGVAIDAEVDLCLTDGVYFLKARLNVSLPGVERELAQALADAAHETCP